MTECPKCHMDPAVHARYGMCPVVMVGVSTKEATHWLLNSCDKCLCDPCQCENTAAEPQSVKEQGTNG